MDQIEERLAEEVRKYEHLYNPSSKDYKDCQMAQNSWGEIATSLEMDTAECVRRWKTLRDKFVRMKKKLQEKKSGDPAGQRIPAFYIFLSWLAPHIKHRVTDSNYNEKENISVSPPSPTTLPAEEVAPAPSPVLQDEPITPHQPLQPHQPPSAPSTSRVRQTEPDSAGQLRGLPSARKRKGNGQQNDEIDLEVAQLKRRRAELREENERVDDVDDILFRAVANMVRGMPPGHRVEARRRLFDLASTLDQAASQV